MPKTQTSPLIDALATIAEARPWLLTCKARGEIRAMRPGEPSRPYLTVSAADLGAPVYRDRMLGWLLALAREEGWTVHMVVYDDGSAGVALTEIHANPYEEDFKGPGDLVTALATALATTPPQRPRRARRY